MNLILYSCMKWSLKDSYKDNNKRNMIVGFKTKKKNWLVVLNAYVYKYGTSVIMLQI
jgi:hypothetical protein